jgi:hypothetical protein
MSKHERINLLMAQPVGSPVQRAGGLILAAALLAMAAVLVTVAASIGAPADPVPISFFP